jgi:flagellar biosynthesis chaperone FliJ
MPYDELGNYIPGADAPSVDEMKYELAKREERRKASTVSDLLDRYVSDPIRGVSTAGSEIIKRLPGADLAQAAMSLGSGIFAMPASVPYAIGKEVASGNFGEAAGKQVANKSIEEAMRELTYVPRTQGGKDIMEGIAKAIEVSKLPPYIGHIARARPILTGDDVRVMGKRAIETGREIAAIPEDFSLAQQGLRRESNLGGTTYGATMGDVARNVEDVTVGNYQRAKVRQAAQNAPEDTVYDPLRQRREQASVEVYNVPEGAVPYYAVKPTGGQLVKSVDPVTGELRELQNSSIAGISDVYENIRKPTEGQGLINQYLRTFVNRPGMQDIWDDFNAKKVNEEFPGAPSPDQAREAFQMKYPTAKSRNERMTTFFDEFAALPAAQAAAAELGISIPTFEDYQKRINAANTWGQKSFANYIQKYIGTKEDPALQLATQGITFKDAEKLTENAADALNYTSPTELREARTQAGFSPEGEVQPFLKEKLTELKAVDDQLRQMVTTRNGLYEQARTQGVDPASIPEYAELTNKLASKIAEKERITQQAANYKLGKSYETLADMSIEPRTAKDLKRKLSFAEKQLLPYLDKTPDEATLYDINTTTIERLGLTELASKFMDDIVAGKIPIEQIGNVSIPKYIQESASARIAKEAAAKKDLAAQQRLFDNYLQEQVQRIPGDKIFGNAGVLEITNAMTMDEIRRHLSTDTIALDHCVGQGGSGTRGKQYVPMIDPVTGEPPKGSSGADTSYVRNISNNGDKIASFRDLVTGKPVGTVQLSANGGGEFDVGYASGYQNGRMQSTYSDALASYLNSISDQIAGSGDNLTKNGVVDKDNVSPRELRDITGLAERELKQLSFDGMPRFLTRDAIVALNNERKSMLPSAQLNSEAATLNTSFAELLDENQRLNFDLQNADDDMLREELLSRRGEIQSQLNDIGTRVGNMPIEDITNFARELINDAFPANKTTPRSRLEYLDQETPVGLRIQPRVYETMREILRDQRDAVGAPLTMLQQSSVEQEYPRISREIARTINGNMYNGTAVANNIRNNPGRYGLGEYNDQIIDGIARMVEERGIIDPRNAMLQRIDPAQSSLPAATVERLNNLFGNALRGRAQDPEYEQALHMLRQYQAGYQNPPERSTIRDLTENERRMAVGEIQGRITDLERRADRAYLVNTARPQEQRQDLTIVRNNMYDMITEDFGQAVSDYVREAIQPIRYDVATDTPLYIEQLRRIAEREGDPEAQTAMYLIADRLVQGERANVAAAQAERTQLTPPDIFANGIEAQPAQMREVMLTPRDIANEVSPPDAAFGAQRSDALTEAINNEIRALPNTDEELHAYVNAINSRPLDLPFAIENYLVNDRQRNRISDYLIQQASARIDALQRQAERQALQEQQPQDNAGLTPEYMTYLRTRLADATTGDEVIALERDFLQVGNPQGYSPAQIQLIEREIGQRSNEILRGNQPANQIDEAYRQVSDEIRSEYNTREGASVLETFATEPNARRDLANYIRDNPEEYSLRNYPLEIADEVRMRIATEGLYQPNAPQQRLPALREPNNVGNVVQNLINQYPERNQIQALIDDFERGEISELPVAIQNADDFVRDETVSEILDQLVEYRDGLRRPNQLQLENQQPLLTGPQVADIVNRELDRQSDIRNLNRESLRSFRNDMTDVTDFTDPQDMINTLVSLREQYDDAGREGLSDAVGTILRQIDAQVRISRARAEVDRVTAEQENRPQRYRDVNDAFAGIMYDNSQFNTPETLDALNALPQLIRRPGATRNSLGIAGLPAEEINQLARIFEELYRSRTQQFEGNRLPPPEGRKRGGLVKKNSGGKVEPTSPSPSVNDRSKPVEPVKKINNPDAPEFKDIFNRERAIRSGSGSGGGGSGSGADLKQLMNPRAHAYGGSIQSSKNRLLSPNTDEMRYALLKGK